jgi:hypothetical protein
VKWKIIEALLIYTGFVFEETVDNAHVVISGIPVNVTE